MGRTLLAWSARALIIATVMAGWMATIQTAAEDVSPGGRLLMAGAALAASVAGFYAVRAIDRDHHVTAGILLMVVCVSPTVFAYPLNGIVAMLAVVELIRALAEPLPDFAQPTHATAQSASNSAA